MYLLPVKYHALNSFSYSTFRKDKKKIRKDRNKILENGKQIDKWY